MLGWGGTVPTEPKMETDLIKNVGVIFSTWTLSGALWSRRLVASSQFHCQLSFISTLSGLDICSDLHSVCCPDPRACYFLRGICAPASSYFGTRCLQLFLVHMVTVSPICCISANLWFTSAVAPAGCTSFFLNISQTLLVLSVLCVSSDTVNTWSCVQHQLGSNELTTFPLWLLGGRHVIHILSDWLLIHCSTIWLLIHYKWVLECSVCTQLLQVVGGGGASFQPSSGFYNYF